MVSNDFFFKLICLHVFFFLLQKKIIFKLIYFAERTSIIFASRCFDINWTCVKGWRTHTGKEFQHKNMINRKIRIVDSRQFVDYVCWKWKHWRHWKCDQIIMIFVYFVFESVSHRFPKRLICYVSQVVSSEWSTNSNPNCIHIIRCLPKAIIRL